MFVCLVSFFLFKEIKNAPSALLSYISTRDFFKNTREVLKKHEPQANAFRTSRVFLKKIPCAYIIQRRARNKFFISFIKCIVNCARSYCWRRLRALYLDSAIYFISRMT